ncbi:hypothetical protein BB559_001382 [Furculomyces boomerangus]|uniref:Uncharacterized protein n=2 Tax=Harpellales TaxID=61421 RepID=A0A2T9Z237_9FUNG|nr:hypothetical protein BB559_001382 [Furculomyces boomerangus]PVZ98536.1 hypothetical protein BB558_005445 [Smittium angustum]
MEISTFFETQNRSIISQSQKITVNEASDFHVHLRQDEMLKAMVPTVKMGGTGTILVMPNLVPPLTTTDMVLNYKKQILELDPSLELVMTLYLSPQLTPEEVYKASENGIGGVKMYPMGVTTNSQFGVADLSVYEPTFAAMEEVDMVLNLHGECPNNHAENVCVLNAEEKFLDTLVYLNKKFPKLRIVLEHATTKAAVDIVKQLSSTVACTITVHHLFITIDDWAGHPHNYCKPVAKYPSDRDALREAVLSGNPKFFLGSDSAPHPKEKKESKSPAAGVYTQPIILQSLATFFDHFGKLEMLDGFAGNFGRTFYKLPTQTKKVVLEKSPFIVPNFYTSKDNLNPTKTFDHIQTHFTVDPNQKDCTVVVPFIAGSELPWKICE